MADQKLQKHENVSVEEEEEEKWIKYYSNNHHILLVGEGDFSFSLCLAHSFGSASNIVATSLDSRDEVHKKYKKALSNLDDLKKLGAFVMHEMDATKMLFNQVLKMRRFDRIIFNFPHAGFHGNESDLSVINKHKNLVHGFFMNARHMLGPNGEIHVNHKTAAPFSDWDIELLANQSDLILIGCADFKKEDFPSYNNKRGDGPRSDKPFPLGKCSTFKFSWCPNKAMMKNDPKITRGNAIHIHKLNLTVEVEEPPEESEAADDNPKDRLTLKRKMRSNDVLRRQVETLICELCNVKCESEVVYESHLRGKKHQASLKCHHANQALSAAMPDTIDINVVTNSINTQVQQGVNDPQRDGVRNLGYSTYQQQRRYQNQAYEQSSQSYYGYSQQSQQEALAPPGKARCEICEVECNNAEILEQHKNGRRHRKRLQRVNVVNGHQLNLTVEVEKPPDGSEAADGNPKDGLTLKRKMRSNDGLRRRVEALTCELCNLKCESEVVYKSHLSGKKHLASLRRIHANQSMSAAMPNTIDIMEQHKNSTRHKKSWQKVNSVNGYQLNLTVEVAKAPEGSVAADSNPKDGLTLSSKTRSKAGLRRREGALICELCNVKCESEVVYKNHLRGRKHLASLRRLHANQALSAAMPNTNDIMEQHKNSTQHRKSWQRVNVVNGHQSNLSVEVAKAPEGSEAADGNPKDSLTLNRKMRSNDGLRRQVEALICELCNIKCESEVVYESHLRGKKHLASLNRLHANQALSASMPTTNDIMEQHKSNTGHRKSWQMVNAVNGHQLNLSVEVAKAADSNPKDGLTLKCEMRSIDGLERRVEASIFELCNVKCESEVVHKSHLRGLKLLASLMDLQANQALSAAMPNTIDINAGTNSINTQVQQGVIDPQRDRVRNLYYSSYQQQQQRQSQNQADMGLAIQDEEVPAEVNAKLNPEIIFGEDPAGPSITCGIGPEIEGSKMEEAVGLGKRVRRQPAWMKDYV